MLYIKETAFRVNIRRLKQANLYGHRCVKMILIYALYKKNGTRAASVKRLSQTDDDKKIPKKEIAIFI